MLPTGVFCIREIMLSRYAYGLIISMMFRPDGMTF